MTGLLIFLWLAGIILSLSLVEINCQRADPTSDATQVKLYHYANSQNSTERYDLSDPSFFGFGKLTKGKRVKIMIHGAGGHCNKDDVPLRVVQAYLRAKAAAREDYNVLCLDYNPLSQLVGPVPGEAIPSIKGRYEYVAEVVSEKVSNLIVALKSNGYISSLGDVHIIGHSLGGQISGFVGRKIQEKTNYQKKLGRITGLDIMNIFLVYKEEVNLRNQLDLSDASFVDIIHTSPIGLKGDYGHADFYPDGGLHQNSCFSRGPISNVTEMLTGGCSHIIVGRYWENSIDNPGITACNNDSWENFSKRQTKECKPEDTVIFGEYVPINAHGRYYLDYPQIKI